MVVENGLGAYGKKEADDSINGDDLASIKTDSPV